MAGYVCIGALAAFGLLSALWCLFGFLVPAGEKGMLICTGDDTFVHRYVWLRSLGLIRCPLRIPDRDFTEAERARLTEQGVEICSREDLLFGIGIGAEED